MKLELTEQSILNIISMVGLMACLVTFIWKGSLEPDYVLPLFVTYLLPSPISEKLKGVSVSKSGTTKANSSTSTTNTTNTAESVIELTDGGYEDNA